MNKTIQLTLSPETAFDESAFRKRVLGTLGIPENPDTVIRKTRQSIDARGRQVKVLVKAEVYPDGKAPRLFTYNTDYPDVSRKEKVVIVGSGPAGLFAALRLMESGIKPVILERGKDVQSRRRDLAAINKEHIVNPDSNYCFGEGGAGTYSDGKLYTRATKRGDVRRILEIFAAHGAHERILVEAHPHIGTNKLPRIIALMRENILSNGGEIWFDARVTDLIIRNREIRGVVTADGREFTGAAVILATGHSARDIFELLHRKDILIEAKPFAMGVRIEHPQHIIDRIQYHCAGDRGPYLPAAAYSVVTQTCYKGVRRGVFSFCMCPGGFIVPAATAPGEVVVNGMSPSRRDSPYANSGMVVAVTEEDMKPFARFGPLAGMQMQKELEQRAFRLAGETQAAPAQRVLDYVSQKVSAGVNDTSYQPGLKPVDLFEVLPGHISHPLREGLVEFGRRLKGYVTNEAQLAGVESRTSSPVRIPRLADTCEHPVLKRLYPCGEGAGYAGGIMSAAMDGERCAEHLLKTYIHPD